MRVALISEHASPLADMGGIDAGGQNVYVARLAKHLAMLGHEVDVFTRKDAPHQPLIKNWMDNIRVIHVPAGPAEFVRKEALLPYMEDFTKFVKTFIKRQPAPYDIVHAHFWMSGLVAHKIKKSFGIPFVMTFHALGRIRRLYQGKADEFPAVRIKIEETLVAEADHIIAECPQDQKDLVRFYNANISKATVIPCGFDPDEIWPVDRELARVVLGLPQDCHLILQLGRMVPRKGVDTVIEGFERVIKGHRLNAKLIIVGGETKNGEFVVTPEIARLKKIVLSEGIADHVDFRGPCRREELKYYYSAADLFVTMPWYEPFGITPLEAMACGLPVIGSKVGGLKFTIQDQRNGFLIQPNDTDALGDAIAFTLNHPPLRQMMGQMGQRRVRELFGWEMITEAIALIYEKAIRGDSPSFVNGMNGHWDLIFGRWKERRDNNDQTMEWMGVERRLRWF